MYPNKTIIILLTILASALSSSSKFHLQPLDSPRTLITHQLSKSQWISVDKYGATANGTDDSQAFLEAWRTACNASNGAVFVVPRNKVYHLKPITFSGPCNPHFRAKIYGTIKASSHQSDYEEDRRHWIVFEDLEKFVVDGGGTINGNGKIWWVKSCKVDKSQPCIGAPTAITFRNCKDLSVNNLRIKNSQQMHLVFQNSINARASNLRVISPEDSPNTDGIHITGSQNVRILKSVVQTGDDCVSIVSGSSNILVQKIQCGPGHGISIGSLGKNKAEDKVSNILVDSAIISNTTNGLRIKSWQGGSGYAKNIRFQNIMMHNVTNPIIVDQHYCDQEKECPEQRSAVQMKNVVYTNIKGTTNSEVAINFDCSKTFPCQAILLENIILNRVGNEGDMKASCSNVDLTTRGKVSPPCQ